MWSLLTGGRVWPGAPGQVGPAGRASGLAVESPVCGERPELPQERQYPGLTQAAVRTAEVRRGPSVGPGQPAEGVTKEVRCVGHVRAHVYVHAFTCAHMHMCVYACVHTGRVCYPGWGLMHPRDTGCPGLRPAWLVRAQVSTLPARYTPRAGRLFWGDGHVRTGPGHTGNGPGEEWTGHRQDRGPGGWKRSLRDPKLGCTGLAEGRAGQPRGLQTEAHDGTPSWWDTRPMATAGPEC